TCAAAAGIAQDASFHFNMCAARSVAVAFINSERSVWRGARARASAGCGRRRTVRGLSFVGPRATYAPTARRLSAAHRRGGVDSISLRAFGLLEGDRHLGEPIERAAIACSRCSEACADSASAPSMALTASSPGHVQLPLRPFDLVAGDEVTECWWWRLVR